MRLPSALALSAALTTSTQAMASDWRFIIAGVTQTDTYVDAESIKISSDDDGPYRLAWVKRDHKNDKTVADRETKALYKFRCETRESGAMAITRYDARGRITYSDNMRFPEFEPVIPDSVHDYTLRFVCSR